MSQLFYEVEIIDESIVCDGISYPKSVKVVEFSSQKKISERYLGYVDREKIYLDIDHSKELFFNKVYVKDFSIADYKLSRNIDPKASIEIVSATFENSFFDCDSVIDFSHSSFIGDVKFRGSIFYHGSLNFMHCHFNNDLTDFSNCKFYSYLTVFQYSKFEGKTLKFENSKFNGDLISFINASLKNEVINFKRVNFNNSKVKFHFAEFGDGLITFEKMKFFGPVLDFRRVIFGKGKLDFRRSLFGAGHVTFEDSEVLSGKVTFRLAKIEGGDMSFRGMDFGKGEVNFDHINFGCNTISFEGVVANKISISNSNIRANLDLRIKKVDVINLSNSYLHSITDLNFPKQDALNRLNITGVRNLGKIIIDWKKNKVKDLILNQEKKTNAELADQFNIIKDNFTKNGQYSDEDWAYVYYKRYEHKDEREKSLKKYKSVSPFIKLGYFFRYIVFDKMGLFATSPNRVLFSMIATIFAFAGIYILFHYLGIGEIVNSVDASDALDVVDKSLYHSAITFFTIGYGDFYPTSFNRMISAMEGWVGVFMMSYFTVAFVRKILR